MNENKVITHPNLQNAAKSVFREKLVNPMLMLEREKTKKFTI